MRRLLKYIYLAWTGGTAYVTFEVLWRGHSHWTMLLVAAMLAVEVGLINNVLPWSLGLVWQATIGTAMITATEFVTGCIVNLWLGWDVWDYSDLPGNVLGQICPQYIALWIPLTLAIILRDDYLQWWLFGEDKPHYRFV